MLENNNGKAFSLLQKAVGLNLKDVVAHIYLSRTYNRMKNTNAALNEINIAYNFRDVKTSSDIFKAYGGIYFNIKEEENELYDLISDQSIQLDDLVEKTNIDIPKISDILLRLQLKKLIKQLPGRQFTRT